MIGSNGQPVAGRRRGAIRNPRDEFIACHEAGHAVIAHYLGVGIKFVSIRCEGPRTHYKARDCDLEAETRIKLALGGPKAIEHSYGTLDERDVCDKDDMHTANVALESLNLDKQAADALWKGAQATVVNVLNERWAAIDALVPELVRKRMLCGARVVKIIQEALSGTSTISRSDG